MSRLQQALVSQRGGGALTQPHGPSVSTGKRLPRELWFQNLNMENFPKIGVARHRAPLASFCCWDLRSDAGLIWVWPEMGHRASKEDLARTRQKPISTLFKRSDNVKLCVRVCARLNLPYHAFSVCQGPKYPVTLWDQRSQKLLICVMREENDQKSDNCPQPEPHKGLCVHTQLLYWFLSLGSHMNRQGCVLLSFGPSVATSLHMENGGLELRLKGWLH